MLNSLVSKIWLLYPLLLLGLPNDLRLDDVPIAFESILQLLVLGLGLLTDITFNQGRRLAKAVTKTPIALHLLFVIMLVSATTSSVDVAMYHIMHLFLWYMTFFYAVFYIVDAQSVKYVLNVWAALSVIGAIVYIFSPALWGESEVNIMAWEHRTGFGYFLSVPCMYVIYKAIFSTSFRDKVIPLVVLIPLLLGIVLTYSRGPWLLIALSCMVFFWVKHLRILAISYLILTAIFIYTYTISSDSEISLRIRSIYDFDIGSSSLYRLDLFLSAIKSIPDLGVFGEGPGSSIHVLPQHTLQYYQHMDIEDSISTDSDVILIIIESGLIAIFCLFYIIHKWISVTRTFVTTHTVFSDVYAINVILLIAFIALIFFDNILTSSFGWYILGYGWGTSKILSAARPNKGLF